MKNCIQSEWQDILTTVLIESVDLESNIGLIGQDEKRVHIFGIKKSVKNIFIFNTWPYISRNKQ